MSEAAPEPTNFLLPSPATPAIPPEDKQARIKRLERNARARNRRAKRKQITEMK